MTSGGQRQRGAQRLRGRTGALVRGAVPEFRGESPGRCRRRVAAVAMGGAGWRCRALHLDPLAVPLLPHHPLPLPLPPQLPRVRRRTCCTRSWRCSPSSTMRACISFTGRWSSGSASGSTRELNVRERGRACALRWHVARRQSGTCSSEWGREKASNRPRSRGTEAVISGVDIFS